MLTQDEKKSNKKNILYLNLQRQYFDKIDRLQKRYEYRDRTPYYRSRIVVLLPCHWITSPANALLEDKVEHFTHIWFMHGMQTHSRQMLVEFLGLEKTHNKYVLKLGKIVSRDISTIDNLVHW